MLICRTSANKETHRPATANGTRGTETSDIKLCMIIRDIATHYVFVSEGWHLPAEKRQPTCTGGVQQCALGYLLGLLCSHIAGWLAGGVSFASVLVLCGRAALHQMQLLHYSLALVIAPGIVESSCIVGRVTI